MAHVPPAPRPYPHLLASVLAGVMGCSGHPPALSSYAVPILSSELMHVGAGVPAGAGAVGGGDKEGSRWGGCCRQVWLEPQEASGRLCPLPAGTSALVSLSQGHKSRRRKAWVPAATAWYHKGPKAQTLSSPGSGGWSLEIQLPTALPSGESRLPGPHTAPSHRCLCVRGCVCAVGGKQWERTHQSLLKRTLIPSQGSHPLALGLHTPWALVPSPAHLLACFLEPEGLSNDDNHSRESGPCLWEHYWPQGISHRLSNLHPTLPPATWPQYHLPSPCSGQKGPTGHTRVRLSSE